MYYTVQKSICERRCPWRVTSRCFLGAEACPATLFVSHQFAPHLRNALHFSQPTAHLSCASIPSSWSVRRRRRHAPGCHVGPQLPYPHRSCKWRTIGVQRLPQNHVPTLRSHDGHASRHRCPSSCHTCSCADVLVLLSLCCCRLKRAARCLQRGGRRRVRAVRVRAYSLPRRLRIGHGSWGTPT